MKKTGRRQVDLSYDFAGLANNARAFGDAAAATGTATSTAAALGPALASSGGAAPVANTARTKLVGALGGAVAGFFLARVVDVPSHYGAGAGGVLGFLLL